MYRKIRIYIIDKIVNDYRTKLFLKRNLISLEFILKGLVPFNSPDWL